MFRLVRRQGKQGGESWRTAAGTEKAAKHAGAAGTGNASGSLWSPPAATTYSFSSRYPENQQTWRSAVARRLSEDSRRFDQKAAQAPLMGAGCGQKASGIR